MNILLHGVIATHWGDSDWRGSWPVEHLASFTAQVEVLREALQMLYDEGRT
jgi:hypothetical protein